jgi:hypothetical protein
MGIKKLKQPIVYCLATGDYFLRGKIISIEPRDNRHFAITLQYKTVPNKKVIVFID